LLLENDSADLRAQDADGGTALHWAAGRGHDTVVRLLLEHGADLAAKDGDGDTALHVAAGRGYDIVVRLLLEKGADVTATTVHGGTALHRAVGLEHKAVVQLLLEHCEEHGIPVHDRDKHVSSRLLVNPNSHLFCDNCDARIPDSDPHYHCSICDDDDFDICQKCVDEGIWCHGDSHRLVKRLIKDGECINITAQDGGAPLDRT
jgi:ankyrin repeat protein